MPVYEVIFSAANSCISHQLRYVNAVRRMMTLADDSQIYLSFESGDPLKQEIAFETINCVISDTRSWMAAMMNDDKTELAIFGTRQELNKLEHPLSIISGEELVFPSEKIRNLGVILDPCLRLHLHINNNIRVCVFHLHNIAKIRKFLTFDACQAVVHAFVSSRLDILQCSSLRFALLPAQLPATNSKLCCPPCTAN